MSKSRRDRASGKVRLCNSLAQFKNCLSQIRSEQESLAQFKDYLNQISLEESASDIRDHESSSILINKILNSSLYIIGITILIHSTRLTLVERQKSHLAEENREKAIETELIKPVSAQEKLKVPHSKTISAVTALGRIEPQGKILQLSPPPDLGGAKVAQLLVKQGDLVSQGETIAVLDNHKRVMASLEFARQEVKIAQADLAIVRAGAKQGEIKAQSANLQRVKAQLKGEIVANEAEIARLHAQLATEKQEKQAIIARHVAEYKNQKSELQRHQQLAREGAISESDLDARRLAADTAQRAVEASIASYHRTENTLQQQLNQAQAIAQQNKGTIQERIFEAEATLDSIAEVREVDLAKAQAEVNRAIAQLHQAEEDLQLTYVKAPTNGQIIEINTYPGELVGDDGIVELGETSKMMVVAEVYESDIGKVKAGQKAIVTSETKAFKGEISGTVEKIGLKIGRQDLLSTDPAADVDSRVIEVKIHLDAKTSKRVAHLTNSKAIVKINTSRN